LRKRKGKKKKKKKKLNHLILISTTLCVSTADPMQSYVDGLAFSHVLGEPKGSVFRVYLRDSRGRPVETKLAGITMAADDDVKAAFEGKTHIDPGGVLRTQYSCGVSGYIKWMVHILGVHVRGSPLSISCDVFVPPAAMLASLAAIPKSTTPVHLEVAPGPGDDGVGVERIGRGKRAERVAYATLVTKDIYVVGAIVLQHTLLQAMDRGARRAPLLALVTESLSARAVRTLHAAGIVVRHVPQTLNPTRKMFSRGRREDSSFAGWSDVFAKLHVWNMTEYDRIVMMDADTLIVGDPSPLLEMDELSAAPEGAGPPVAFNSGVFVLRPSAETHAALIAGINDPPILLLPFEGPIISTSAPPPPLTFPQVLCRPVEDHAVPVQPAQIADALWRAGDPVLVVREPAPVARRGAAPDGPQAVAVRPLPRVLGRRAPGARVFRDVVSCLGQRVRCGCGACGAALRRAVHRTRRWDLARADGGAPAQASQGRQEEQGG
jgi:hypothetical protein